MDEFAQNIRLSTRFTQCRDPKDNYLLSLAVDGNAYYIVTGDKDLLSLRQINSTQIVSPAIFEQILSFL